MDAGGASSSDRQRTFLDTISYDASEISSVALLSVDPVTVSPHRICAQVGGRTRVGVSTRPPLCRAHSVVPPAASTTMAAHEDTMWSKHVPTPDDAAADPADPGEPPTTTTTTTATQAVEQAPNNRRLFRRSESAGRLIGSSYEHSP